jgi:hypothetical protein
MSTTCIDTRELVLGGRRIQMMVCPDDGRFQISTRLEGHEYTGPHCSVNGQPEFFGETGDSVDHALEVLRRRLAAIVIPLPV